MSRTSRPLEGGGGTWVRLGQSSTISGKLEAVHIKVNMFFVALTRCRLSQGLKMVYRKLRLLKGSVSRNFQPPVFFMIRTHLGP